jgi:integrase
VFVLTALRTGLRLGELRALTWDDVDWRGRYLRIARNFVEGRTTTPKSGLVRRVDVSSQLHEALRRHRIAQRRTWLQAKQKPKVRPRLVFPSARWTVLDDANIRTAIRAITEAADVRPRPRPVHVFRHTFCSLLVQQGESLVYVKEQAGHSSIQVTADIYARFMPGGNRGAVDKLDKAGAK